MKKILATQPEIKLVGITARTNNKNEMDPVTAKIGGLLGRYWSENIAAQIAERKNPSVTFSVYTAYESNEHGDYTYFLGEEVESFTHVPAGLQAITVPAATYQKFTTPAGKMPEVVIDAWQQIWKMSANDFGGARAYQADFELYDQRASDLANAVVDIYIGIRP